MSGKKRVLVCSDNGLGSEIARRLGEIAPVDRANPMAAERLPLKSYGVIVLNLQPARENQASQFVTRAREKGVTCPIFTFRTCETEKGKDPFKSLVSLVQRRL